MLAIGERAVFGLYRLLSAGFWWCGATVRLLAVGGPWVKLLDSESMSGKDVPEHFVYESHYGANGTLDIFR